MSKGLLILTQVLGVAVAINTNIFRSSVSSSGGSCAGLKNRGSHFTVGIDVGTPPQRFDVVADTGSNAVIVNSCVCQDMHHCDSSNKCFRGTNRSSTFSMMAMPDGQMASVVMSFGSGQIQAVVTSDMVQVGKVSANMTGQLLLMVNQALQIAGPFEGILGLGLPVAAQSAEEQSGAAKGKQEEISFREEDLGERPTKTKDGKAVAAAPRPGAAKAAAGGDGFEVKGFLEMANISQFSMCFNEGTDGVLRLGQEPSAPPMGSIGHMHWGLDFQGISVGNHSAPVTFCDPSSKKEGAQTACGGIPDSGTTLIMADEGQLNLLFGSICDSWGRCSRRAKNHPKMSKQDVLGELFMNCGKWLDNTTGLNELPDLHFHVAGSDGRPQTLKLPGSAYVLETEQEEVQDVTKSLWGVFKVHFSKPTGKMVKTCMPAFGAHNYVTSSNGPVWIMGTPFFYQYQVGYDMAPKPPTIAFSDETCGTCSEGAGGTLSGNPRPLLFSKSAQRGHARVKHAAPQPRKLGGKIRLPNIDTTQPL